MQSDKKPRQLFDKAILLLQKNQTDEARKNLEKLIEKFPDFSDVCVAYNEVGNIALQRGDRSVAKYNYLQAIAKRGSFSEAHNNLGILLAQEKNLQEAISVFNQAIKFDPKNQVALKNLAQAYFATSQYSEAANCIEDLLRINSLDTDAMNLAGSIYFKLNEMDRAENWYQRIIQADPTFVLAYMALGEIYALIAEPSISNMYFEKALLLNPKNEHAYNFIGNNLQHCGRHEEADEAYQKAFELASTRENRVLFYSNRLLGLNYVSSYNEKDIFELHAHYDALFQEPLFQNYHHGSETKIRVGYVSRDFRGHSVAYFILGILAGHDKGNFDVYCYSDVKNPDDVTVQLKKYASVWREVSAMNDKELAELIYSDQVDILIDLAGHTGNNRLPVFALKPAPIQGTWIGYPNTTGLNTVDFRITDGYADPEGADENYTERLIRLPNSFLCYTPSSEATLVGELPYITNKHITYGCFNNYAKLTDQTLALWKIILDKVPNSKLILKAKVFADSKVVEGAKERFAKLELDLNRVTLLSWEKSVESHLDQYNTIDIALDTYPYNGATTTCEAVFMGVPVVTLAGTRHASRVGLSLLSNIGLPECIAFAEEDYVTKVVALSDDINKLAELRTRLRTKVKSSPLMNIKQFVFNLENAYSLMWKQWTDKMDRSIAINGLYDEIRTCIETLGRGSLDSMTSILPCVEKIYSFLAATKNISGKEEYTQVVMNVNDSLNRIMQNLSQEKSEPLLEEFQGALLPLLTNFYHSLEIAVPVERGKRQLHIGGKIRSPQWEVFNAVAADYVDHLGNAKDLSRFADDTFETVYASHVLEHFDYNGEIQAVLKEWYRVIAPYGKLLISVPDLDKLASLLVNKKLTTAERFHVMKMIFGGHVDEYDYHKVGLTYDFLEPLLHEAGFVSVAKVSTLDFFHDTSSLMYRGVPISINVIAVKDLQVENASKIVETVEECERRKRDLLMRGESEMNLILHDNMDKRH